MGELIVCAARARHVRLLYRITSGPLDVWLPFPVWIGFIADGARILADALTLPVHDRARGAHQLLRCFEAADPDAAAAWPDQIRRPIDEVEAGTAQLGDWETAKARVESPSRT